MTTTLTPQDTHLGRPVANRITFNLEGDFQSYYAASAHLKAEGQTQGSMCGGEPIGFAPADKFDYIAKWRNIEPADRRRVHGILSQTEGFRNGPVEVIYFGDI